MTKGRRIAAWPAIVFALAALTAGWFAALAPSAASAATGKRVALVVGIANYQSVAPLKNTTNDADRMAAMFERLGFEVVKAMDPGRGKFEEALRSFGAKARQAEASVFFYAGHAIEVEGRNWLLPADARLETKQDLRFEAVDVEAVLDQAQAARIAVMFLDACRNNPFATRIASGDTRAAATRGLARIDPAAGVLVAFATAPGQVALDGAGEHSPFTEALLKHIETPGLEIRQLMARVRSDVRRATRDQVPWEQSALEGEFYFRTPAVQPVAAPAPALAAAPPPPPALDPEALFWDSVRGSESEAEISAYLEKFPTGLYASLARNRLAQLKQARAAKTAALASPSPAPAPAAPAPAPTPQGAAPPATAPAPIVAPPIAAPPEPLSRQSVASGAPTLPPAPQSAAPVAPRPETPPSPPIAAPVAGAPALDEGKLVAALAPLGPEAAGREARAYLAAGGFKAMALSPTGAGVWRVAGRDGAAEAEESALEGCQFVNRTPCTLVAAGDRAGGPELRSMARLFYSGGVHRDWIPFVSTATRASAEIAAYGERAGGKAIAVRPDGRTAIRFAAEQRAAEEAALKGCGEGCFLYAAGASIVLSRRATTPLAPAAVAALTPPPAPSPPAVDRGALVKQAKAQLKRVGCYAGAEDESWDAGAKKALADLGRASKRAFPQEPGTDLVTALAKEEGRVCPLVCQRGFVAQGESCVEIVCGEGEVKNSKGVCVVAPVARPKPQRPERPVVRRPPPEERPVVRRPPPVREVVRPAPPRPRPVVTRPRPEPSGGGGGGRCFTAGGRQYCS